MPPRQAPHHHCLEQRSNAAPALETATEGSRRRRIARALPGDASGGGERGMEDGLSPGAQQPQAGGEEGGPDSKSAARREPVKTTPGFGMDGERTLAGFRICVWMGRRWMEEGDQPPAAAVLC
ncbi:hypothetical protein ZWY2020_005423 [Hordeum vulgare]|nr:hypothetical protein ZWY2020_005423 [Hordeum vulgare]